MGSKTFTWQGFQTKWYFLFLAVVLLTSYLGMAPKGFLGTMTYCLLLGILLTTIGDSIPIIRKYFGGGSIVNLFVCSALAYTGLIPDKTLEMVSALGNNMDLFGFVCMALIMGSILGMDRKLLLKSGGRFAVPIIGCLVCGILFTMTGGFILNYGAKEALFNIGLPIFGAGAASGAVPISQIYESVTGIDAKTYLSQLMPAVALGNAVAIIIAGLLDGLGKKYPSLTGNGNMLKDYTPEEHKEMSADFGAIGSGMIITGTFMTAGVLLSKVIPIHYYASTIILCAIVKICNLIPEELIEHCGQWYRFVSRNFVPAIIAVTGLASMDMGLLINALSIQYIILIILCIAGCAFGAGIFGKLVGFYPIEASITGGLCMANMGGSGDVATLAASNRMSIMQYAQLSSRLGGAAVIVLCNILAALLV